MTHSDAFEAPSPEDLSEIITGFRVGPILAAGSESDVYSAIQSSLDRQVALRVYSTAASSDPERVRMVESTTRAMAQLKHPNLIGLFDSGTREGMIYVVMEFVAGKSLARSLGGNPIDHAQARSILMGICDGLAHAHQHQIAHGNLTVDSILLNPEAEPKIGSFQSRGFEEGKIADIVAVGHILYRMLTGLEGTLRSVEPSVLVGSPKDLDEIWSRCTHRDHPDAITSIEEIASALSKGQAKPVGLAGSARATGARATLKPSANQSLPVVKKLAQAPPATTAKSQVSPVQSPASHWTLIRNLVIIVILVIAIVKVWGMTQRKQREMEREQQAAHQRATLEAEQRRQEAMKKRLSNANRVPQVPRVPSEQVPDKLAEIKEAPLNDIREALQEGKREVLPVGSVRRGDSVYLLVRDPLSWPEAQWFAERHGAHLAIPDESADLTWLQSIAEGEHFWLGAAKSGRSSWRLVNGSPWQPAKEPVGLGRYLGADKFGFLRAAGGGVRLSSILQWKMDGSNPGQMEALLAATAASLSSDEPAYPPGTHLVAERWYLVVSRDVVWEEANRLAMLAGGHLAVVSDAAEEVHIADLAKDLTPERLYWMGARKTGAVWQSVTKEPWRDVGIAVDSIGAAAALAISSTARMQAADATSPLSGFIIEWSGDASSVSSSENAGASGADQAPGVVGLMNSQVKRLLQTALDKRNKELKANASKMESDLTIVARNMTSTAQQEWNPRIDAVKQLIVDKRVPLSDALSGTELNEDMKKIVSFASAKQQSIDLEFQTTANQIREAYQRRLRDIMTKALGDNDRKTVLELKPKLDASERLEPWLDALGIAYKQ